MNLDEAQRKQVSAWIAEGLKLSDIQNRLVADLGVRMTYMEVRLLVDDLKLTPKDIEPPKPQNSLLTAPAAAGSNPVPASPPPPTGEPATGAGGVTVSVDHLARPGAMVSGKVTFSDGMTADWTLDQMGRLGLSAQQPGYRPSAPDVQEFQQALERELSRMGM
jgi:hypothetical protein